MKVYSWAWLPFVAFVVMSGFIIVNLIIAVICEALSELESDELDKIFGEESSVVSEQPEEDVMLFDPTKRISKHIGNMEDQVRELFQSQEQAMNTLKFLSQHLKTSHTNGGDSLFQESSFLHGR